jgi:hypothetical protein
MVGSDVFNVKMEILLLGKTITGSPAQSYIKSRVCPFCTAKFDFIHFISSFSCPKLGADLSTALGDAAAREDWVFPGIILSRFQVFIHLFRHGHCDVDEMELLDCLDSEKE